jgi:ABC-type transporter Mla subunit MlaD
MFEQLEALAAWIIRPEVIIGYVIMLGLIFLVNQVWFLRHFFAVRKGVIDGFNTIKGLGGERDFARRFPTVDERLQKNRVLSEAWAEFKECLIHPVSPDESIQNSRDASEYFHGSAIIERHLSIRYYNSVPNILTGLGILGTFVGLAAGIGLAQASLSADQLQEVQAALQNLLRGASLAFITSIAGLLLSIVFLGTERVALRRLQGRLHTFIRKVDSLVARVTPERVLTEQLAELKGQTGQLKRFNTDLAVSIADALDGKLSERLSPALERLITAVHQLRDGQEGIGEETIRTLVESFRETMSGATGAEFERITKTLQGIDSALTQATERLGERERALQETIQTFVSSVGSTLSETTERVQADVHAGVGEMLAGVGQSVLELRTSIVEGQGEATASLQTAIERLQAHVEETIGRTTQQLDSAAGGIRDRLGEAAEGVSDVLRESTAGLGEEVGRLQSQMGSMVDLMEAVRSASGQLSAAAQGTERMVQQLSDMEGTLSSAATEIAAGGRASENAVISLRDGVTAVQASVRTLSDQQTEMARAWEDYRGRFEGVDQSLRGVFTQIESGLERYTEQVANFNRSMDQNLARAVESLGGVVQELSELVEDLGDHGDATGTLRRTS